MKRCTACEQEKPRSEFYANASSRAPDGLQYKCKDCDKASARARHSANVTRASATRQAWREANRGKDLASHKRWAAANPERQRESWRVVSQTRRAARRGILAEYVDPLVLLELDDGICGICGSDVDPCGFHMDHIVPVSRGGLHCYANMQVSHPRCNASKHATLPWDLDISQTSGSFLKGSPSMVLESAGLWRFISTRREGSTRYGTDHCIFASGYERFMGAGAHRQAVLRRESAARYASGRHRH